jgi:hypothetical protein
MKIFKKIALGFLIVAIVYSGSALNSFSLRESYYWLKSFTSFHITLWYNKLFLQKNCPFHCILAPYSAIPVAQVIIGPENTILLIADGLRAPIYLGRIIESPDDLINLRLVAGFSNNNQLIAIHTLNRWFEQWFADLPNTIEKDGNVVQYQYSTTDFTPPSLIDLIRGVYNLKERDRRDEKLAYVHCKAGRARSATLIVAYLLYVYTIAQKTNLKHEPYSLEKLAEIFPTDDALIEALIAYVKKQRSVIGLHEAQKKVIKKFYTELKKYGSFDALYEHYADAIHERDAEFKTPHLVT